MNKMIDKLRSMGLIEESVYLESLEQTNYELRKEKDRYKNIVSDLKTFGHITEKIKEELRDLKC